MLQKIKTVSDSTGGLKLSETYWELKTMDVLANRWDESGESQTGSSNLLFSENN